MKTLQKKVPCKLIMEQDISFRVLFFPAAICFLECSFYDGSEDIGWRLLVYAVQGRVCQPVSNSS